MKNNKNKFRKKRKLISDVFLSRLRVWRVFMLVFVCAIRTEHHEESWGFFRLCFEYPNTSIVAEYRSINFIAMQVCLCLGPSFIALDGPKAFSLRCLHQVVVFFFLLLSPFTYFNMIPDATLINKSEQKHHGLEKDRNYHLNSFIDLRHWRHPNPWSPIHVVLSQRRIFAIWAPVVCC